MCVLGIQRSVQGLESTGRMQRNGAVRDVASISTGTLSEGA